MDFAIFTVGFVIFATYMFFLVRMINTQHKIQEKEHGKSEKVKRVEKIIKELEKLLTKN